MSADASVSAKSQDQPCLFSYGGPEELRDKVVSALTAVVDPELALTIVDLGLVYGVEVDDDTIRVRMTMTSVACPVTDVIVDEVEFELERALPDRAIAVELCWEPAWTPERMSARARRFMG